MAFFTDLGQFPEAVILLSRPLGGVSLRDYLPTKWQRTWPSVLPRHVDRRSSRLPPHNRASLISVREFVGGGLNCEAKAQVLIVMPSPLFFLEVGRKNGGGVTAGQYSICIRSQRIVSSFVERIKS